MTTPDDDLTAPTLLWLHTRRARVVAAVFIAATLASLPNYGEANPNLPWLILAVTIVAAGIGLLLAARSDPMPVGSAAVAAACVPVGALITALALPGHVSNPNQTNALGAGVALCAFLCVRGRANVAIMSAWGQWTDQGAWAGFLVELPNLAVLAMATMFARIMRPAARDVRALREQEAREHADIVASRERDAERARQRDKLQRQAWPSISMIASGVTLTPSQISDIVLLEQEIRDSIRSPFFDAPQLQDAARAARVRGVEVELLDDHGLDDDAELAEVFAGIAAGWLAEAVDGEITVRVFPPGRAERASIVAIADGTGEGRELSMSADGVITTYG
jgi:hypothetical protein